MPPGSWATALQARHLAGVWPFLAKAGPGIPVRPGKCDLVGTLEHFPAPWIPVWPEKCDQIGCRPGPKTGRPAAPTAPIQGETVHLGKKIAIALLLLPLAELVGFGLVAWTIGRAIERRRPRTGPGSVIDLRADEWRPVPDPEAPKRE